MTGITPSSQQLLAGLHLPSANEAWGQAIDAASTPGAVTAYVVTHLQQPCQRVSHGQLAAHIPMLSSGRSSDCAREHNRRVPAAFAQGSGAGIDAVAAPGAAAGAEAGTAASKGSPVRPEILSLMPRGAPRTLSMSFFRPARSRSHLSAAQRRLCGCHHTHRPFGARCLQAGA